MSNLPILILAESVSASSDGSSSSSTTSFLSFLCPLLKLFSGGDPSQERNYTLEVATSSLSTLARLPWGSRSLFENLNNQETTTSDPS
ncbi:THIOREDOXIN FAMILY PROTEIN [Salix purpurea]|uniref:THIOREDOXIN FAMILY PROTEIN n=1 Tax=Salix purpurea TaxID=77065 RepID=A0A9Q0WD83_SALPP|nr:THIOREDOXIN FAMILY PROTEIN [Salix purpurea]